MILYRGLFMRLPKLLLLQIKKSIILHYSIEVLSILITSKDIVVLREQPRCMKSTILVISNLNRMIRLSLQFNQRDVFIPLRKLFTKLKTSLKYTLSQKMEMVLKSKISITIRMYFIIKIFSFFLKKDLVSIKKDYILLIKMTLVELPLLSLISL